MFDHPEWFPSLFSRLLGKAKLHSVSERRNLFNCHQGPLRAICRGEEESEEEDDEEAIAT